MKDLLLSVPGRQFIEEANNFDELFNEQFFEEHGGSEEYYDQYTVNPLVDFPRPIVRFDFMIYSSNRIYLEYD